MQLIVPAKFNKNAAHVQAQGTQSETGTWLIKYMCERLAVKDLGGLDVLDFGCGCRFSDALVNNRLPIRSYTGIDVDAEMIAWLQQNVRDPRFSFYHWNAHNPMYNPSGFTMAPKSRLPTDLQKFDLICMFSVITHQLPPDAEILFGTLRRYIRISGRLFFSVNIQDQSEDYREMGSAPTALSAYSMAAIGRMLERTGWRVVSAAGKNAKDASGRSMPIQDSLLCAPTLTVGRLLRRLVG